MMAPNPHWWAEEAVKYSYSRKSRRFPFAMHLTGMMCLMADIVTRRGSVPGPFFWAGLTAILFTFPLEHAFGTHGGTRFETRFNHLTQFQGTTVVEHEDMREIVSLTPVINSRSGKLQYQLATFSTGHSMKIYPNLDRYGELIAKLRSYLPTGAAE